MEEPTLARPRLACNIETQNGELVLTRRGAEYVITPEDSPVVEIRQFLMMLDGRQRLSDLLHPLSPAARSRLCSVVRDLDEHDLLDDAHMSRPLTGMQALLELEDLANSLIEKTLMRNVFWTRVHSVDYVPLNVFYGFAIENYHFLFRESLFDSPVLGYLGSTKVRSLINEFYISEYGHDELVLQALGAIGLTRTDLRDAIPLAETLAMCNSLSYWASTDPLFFFSTLGVLEGKGTQVDPFISVCEAHGLNPSFIAPMRRHAEINRDAQHGNLTREIFKEIELVDEETMVRLRRQTYLFLEIYDSFYTALWNYYSTTASLLRRISKI